MSAKEAVPDLIKRALNALESRDLDTVMKCFADDAVLYDPHYPYAEMHGKTEIREGLEWAYAGMKSMSFTPLRFFTSDDGASSVIELDTHHVPKAGGELEFAQVFVVDTKDGAITSMRSYLPHGPNGFGGFMLRTMHKGFRRKHPRT